MAFQDERPSSIPTDQTSPSKAFPSPDQPPDNPLVHQPITLVTDVDQAQSMFRRFYSDTSILEPAPRLRFHWQVRRAAIAGVTLQVGDFQNPFTFSVEGLDNRFGLLLARTGRASGDVAGASFELVPGRSGALVSPGMPGVIHCGFNYGTLNINIDAQALETHLRALTCRTIRDALRFDVPIDFLSPAGATVQRIALAFCHEVGRADGSPLMIAALRDAFFTSLLTCVPHNHCASLNPRPKILTPGCLRKAEEFVIGHLDKPITLTSIAEELGVSVRSLQTAFRAHRGQSPMQFLREQRLELARQRLLQAEPGMTVAAIATAAGMDHLGRFSVEYKKRFGENPSQTLGRRLRQS